VRLADYKTKFFDYLAGSLRRLAEVLSVEPIAEKEVLTDEKILSPVDDWLEKTRNLAPEQWLEFAGENEFEPESQPTKSSFGDKSGEADFVLKKPEKQPPVEASLENKREPVRRAEASSNPEISLSGKSKKPKSDALFFSFNPAGKKPTSETVAPLEPLSKISGQSSAADEKTLAASRRKFRLLPAKLVSERSRKTSDATAPDIINYAEHQPPPKFEIPTFEQKKSVVKLSETAPPKPEKSIETPESIIKKPARPELSNQFPLESFDGKNRSETATEISFKFPKRKATDEAIFAPQTKETTENPHFPAPWKKSRADVREYVKPSRVEKNDRGDRAKKLAVAESPWIDLPDETAFEANGDVQINLSENEHLRFLKREQAGNR
jgi:hypothetical protein